MELPEDRALHLEQYPSLWGRKYPLRPIITDKDLYFCGISSKFSLFLH